MKRNAILLLLLPALLFSGCGLQGSRPIGSPFWESETAPAPRFEEQMLTELSYGEYLLNGENIPYYHQIGTSSAPFTVCGVPFYDGVYISPAGIGKTGFIEYDISSLSETLDCFVCKVGCLDGEGNSGERISFTFLVDGKLMSRTPGLSYGEEAYLIDVFIPHGAKTLRIECRGDGMFRSGASVIGDGRFIRSQYLSSIKWPK